MSKDLQNTGSVLPAKDIAPPVRLPLGSLKNARRSLTRLMTSFYHGGLDVEKFKGMLYGFNVLLAFLKEERGDEIESRLAALEKAIQERSKQNDR